MNTSPEPNQHARTPPSQAAPTNAPPPAQVQDDPSWYLNRELSWLEFNHRVLQEGMDDNVPLMERLKFLAIVSSNLDEFFMIRVAGLFQQVAANVRRTDISGMTATEQLSTISKRVRQMVHQQTQAIRQVTAALADHGLYLLERNDTTAVQKQFLTQLFNADILPVLTPLAMDHVDTCHTCNASSSNQPDPRPAVNGPVMPPLTLNLALLLKSRNCSCDRPADSGKPATEASRPTCVAVVPVPTCLPRFITIPSEQGLQLARLEDVIADNIGTLFPGYIVQACTVFRVTRDADVSVEEDEAGDLIDAIEQAVHERSRRKVVRLAISAGTDDRLRDWLQKWCDIPPQCVYEIDGMLDAASLMEVANRPGFENLKYPDWPTQPVQDIRNEETLWPALQERDVMLCHPYEAFEPVVRLVEQAADDPSVMAIKMTLYRTSGDSPIISALAAAAENGIQVTVLVELKARFDEAKNVNWARKLEDAGCYVIYGIAGFKTHAKCLLIIRREAHKVRRYAHLATGNYNDKTAKLYSDVGIMTSDPDMTADAAAFFNLLTGYSQEIGWNKFSIAPTGMRRRFLHMIEREIRVSTPDNPGLIMAKINSLQDRAIIQALYRASQAGVRIRLNVRGICCLRPGVPDLSENIEVLSIVDRYLEHARIFYFRNGGHPEVYLSSADWMVRNLTKRLEILFPVQQPNLARRLTHMLEIYLADTAKARKLNSDGTWERVATQGTPLRAQEYLYKQIVEAARVDDNAITEFKPLARPSK